MRRVVEDQIRYREIAMRVFVFLACFFAFPALSVELIPTPDTQCGQPGVGYVKRKGDITPRLVLRTGNGAKGYRVDSDGYWQRCEPQIMPPRNCKLSSGWWPSWYDRRHDLTCYSTTPVRGFMAHGSSVSLTGLSPRHSGPTDRIGKANAVCEDGRVVLRNYWCQHHNRR